MGKQESKQASFDPQAATYQTERDLFGALELPTEGEQADTIAGAIGAILYIVDHEKPPPKKAIPTARQIIQWYNRRLIEAVNKSSVEGVRFLQSHRWGGGVVGIIANHTLWLEARSKGDRPPHPLKFSIEAWQHRPPEIESTRERDQKLPVWIARFPRGSFDVDLFSGGDMGELRRFANDTVLPELQMVLPGFERKSVIRDPNKLLLANVDGVALTTKSGAVSPELRIFVEAIMAVPANERMARVKIKLDELIARLYPGSKHYNWTNQSGRLLAAIRNMDRVTVPFINSSGNIQHGYAPVKLNTMNFQRRNDDVIFSVTLPDSVSGGPVVEKHFVRLIGLKSDPKWQAYLTLCDLFHRYGIHKKKDGQFNIYDPTKPVERRNADGHLLNAKGKVIRSDKGEPLSNLYDPEAHGQLDREPNQWAIDQYPIVSFDDMLKACFPGRVYKNASERSVYLKRAKKHLKALADVPDKAFDNKPLNAIQIIEHTEHTDGWQFLPGKSHVEVYRGVAKSGSK